MPKYKKKGTNIKDPRALKPKNYKSRKSTKAHFVHNGHNKFTHIMNDMLTVLHIRKKGANTIHRYQPFFILFFPYLL